MFVIVSQEQADITLNDSEEVLNFYKTVNILKINYE
jgi:hypothetical protein